MITGEGFARSALVALAHHRFVSVADNIVDSIAGNT